MRYQSGINCKKVQSKIKRKKKKKEPTSFTEGIRRADKAADDDTIDILALSSSSLAGCDLGKAFRASKCSPLRLQQQWKGIVKSCWISRIETIGYSEMVISRDTWEIFDLLLYYPGDLY